MNQKERMLKNLPYKAWLDGLSEERLENKKKIYEFNRCEPEEMQRSQEADSWENRGKCVDRSAISL